jgi:hypothetical protein
MESNDAIDVALIVDRLVLESRLRDLSLLAQTDKSERVGTVATVLSKLPRGAYLIGCGPYCCGILPLTVDEVVLGRPPSPLEDNIDSIADFNLNDAVFMVPREASRIHASVVRRTESGETTYSVQDKGSRGGTYVNGTRVATVEGKSAEPPGAVLSSGDVLSLGPSGVNSYVFCRVT